MGRYYDHYPTDNSSGGFGFTNSGAANFGPWGLLAQGIQDTINIGVGIYDRAENKRIADRNFELEREAFDWQKNQWEEVKEREDNAVSRRVDDLNRAGLSPTLAAGSAASTGAQPAVSAPQNQYKSDLQGILPKVQASDLMMNFMRMRDDFQTSKVQRHLLMEQAKAISRREDRADKEEERRGTRFQWETMEAPERLDALVKANDYTQQRIDELKRNIELAKRFGLRTQYGGLTKELQIYEFMQGMIVDFIWDGKPPKNKDGSPKLLTPFDYTGGILDMVKRKLMSVKLPKFLQDFIRMVTGSGKDSSSDDEPYIRENEGGEFYEF